MVSIVERLKKAFNAFRGRSPTTPLYYYPGSIAYGDSPYGRKFSVINEQSIVANIYNTIAVDVSLVSINHVRLNKEGRFEETIDSNLNYMLTKSANVDQTGRSLIRDAVMRMLENGTAAIFPYLTDKDPADTESFDVIEARVGKIIGWYPEHVLIEIYNPLNGKMEQMLVEKRITAIVENPFYATMNEPNSLMQRLRRVLSQIDRLNEENSAGKIDLLIKLPFALKGEGKTAQAETRRQQLEAQLTQAQYGIGYIDATEQVIQLNRSVDNNLWEQSKDLTEQLYNQLGLSQSIFDGTADEQTMLNFQNRTLEPILYALVEEMERKWLSKTAISYGQAIRFFKDPFKLVPVAKLAEIVDKFTRNEVMSSNEFRSVLMLRPSKDPKADKLINSNLNHPEEDTEKTEEIEDLLHGIVLLGRGLRNKEKGGERNAQ